MSPQKNPKGSVIRANTAFLAVRDLYKERRNDAAYSYAVVSKNLIVLSLDDAFQKAAAWLFTNDRLQRKFQ